MICKALWAVGEIMIYQQTYYYYYLLLWCFNSVETELIRMSLGNPEKSVLFFLHPIFMHWRHRLCVLNGWDRFDEDLLQTPHAAPSQGPNISSADYSLLKPATCRWKKIYMRALLLDKNWAQGRYSVAPLLRGHRDPITCMDCNGKHKKFL